MAGEGDKIRVGNADALEAAAKRALADSLRAADLTDEARRALEDERVKLERQTRSIERALQKTGGRGRNAASSQAAAERKRIRIAEINDELEIGRAAVDNTRAIERQKTEIVRRATREREGILERFRITEQRTNRGGTRFLLQEADATGTTLTPRGQYPTREAAEKYALERSYVSEAAADVERGEARKTRAIQAGERQRQLTRGSSPRVPPARPISVEGTSALQRYIAEAEREEIDRYARRAKEILDSPRTLANYRRGFPAGYDVEAVLRRQVAASAGPTSGVSAAELRKIALAAGANITKGIPSIGSKLETVAPEPRLGDDTARSRARFAELQKYGTFTPAGAPAPPKITYNPAFLREQEQQKVNEEQRTATVEKGVEKRVEIEEQFLGHAGHAAGIEVSLTEQAEAAKTQAAQAGSDQRTQIEEESLAFSAKAAAAEVQIAQNSQLAQTQAATEGAKAREALESGGSEQPQGARLIRSRADIEFDIRRQQQIVDLRQASASPAKRPERTQAGKELTRFKQELADFDAAEAAKGAEAVEKAEKRKTQARKQASDEGKKVAGDAAEFERLLAASSAVDRDAELVKRHREYEAAVKAGTTPAIDTAEAASRAAEERTIAAAREADYRPGNALARTIGVRRDPGPFGQVFRPAGVSSEPFSAAYRPRSPLQALEEQRREAVIAQRESAAALRRAKTPDDLRDAEAAHRANIDRVDTLRRDIRALEAGIAQRVQSTRAEAEHTSAQTQVNRLLPDRYRGGPPVPPPPPPPTAGPPPPPPSPRQGPGTAIEPYWTPYARDGYTGAAGSGGVPPRGPRFVRNQAEDLPEEDPRFAQARDAQAAATARFADAEQRTARVVGLSSDQMHRHGLLTTEFLSALGAGRTTVREMGVQLGGTIAKFGGWTAAASLTYGGLAAISAVGQGAISSAEGVTSLRRVLSGVNTDQAQQQFRNLAQQFNLPVGDVTEAFFQASKAFKTQDEGAKATAASLFAMKVGELDAGEAATFVTAAVRGFNLSADDLGHVVDVVNNLQNKFGASFGQTAKGVAAAAGAFGAAGGKVEELSAFIATGSLRTGRTGTEIATALRRTSEIVRRPERRTRIIDLLGIDPQDSSITEILERAQAVVAERPELGLQIATAISTPELASGRILPILQAQSLYSGLVDAARNAGGSAERELGVALSGISERIKKISVDLSTLGSALGQSGALDTAGIFLLVLDKTLTTTTHLIEAFNQLPRPLRQAALIGAELLGTLAIARRFNLGGVLGGGAVGRFFGRDPGSRRRAEFLTGLAEERAYVVPERTRAALSAARLTDQAKRAYEYAGTLPGRLPGASDADKLEHANAIARAQDIERRSIEETDRARGLADRHERVRDADRDFRQGTRRSVLGASRRDPDVIDRVAVQTGTYFSSEYVDGRPDTSDPRSARPGAPPPPGTRRRKPRPIVTGPRLLTQAAESLRDEATEAAAATEQASRRAGASAATAVAAGRIRSSAQGLGRGIKNIASSIVASIGLLDGIVLGLLAAYAAYQYGQQKLDEQQAQIAAIRTAPRITDPDKARAQIEENRKKGLADRVEDFFAPGVRVAAAALPGGAGGPTGPTQAEIKQRDADHAERLQDRIERGAPYGIARTGPQITATFNRAVDAGVAPSKALAKALQSADVSHHIVTATDELKQAFKSGDDGRIKKATADLANAQADAARYKLGIRSLARQAEALGGELVGLTSGELTELNPAYLYTRGLDKRLVRANRLSITDLRTQLAGSRDSTTSNALIEEINAKQQPLEAEAEARRDRQLRAAEGDPAAEARARERYANTLRQLRIKSTQDALAANRRRLTGGRIPYASAGNGLQQQLERAQAEADTGPAYDDVVGRGGELRIAAKSKAIENLQNAIKKNKADRAHLRRQLRRERVQLNDLLRQADESAEESDAAALFDARTQVLAGDTAAGAPRLKLLIQRAGQVVQNALKHHARNSVEVLNAIAAQQQAAQDLVDFQIAEIQSRANLAAAYATTPGGEAAARIEGLKQQLAKQIEHPKRFNANENRDIQAQIIQAQQDEAKRLREEAEALISSQYDVRRSRTDNPVEIARLNAQEAARRLRRGGFENQTERNQAIANRNTTRREHENAIADRRLENADYAHDIGKLSDEQYIARLRAIQKTYEKGSEGYRRLKQQIGRFKHGLNDATELELTPGNIKLPTLTQIRRFYRGVRGPGAEASTAAPPSHLVGDLVSTRAGLGAGAVSVSNRNHITINVAKGGEFQKVFEALERAGMGRVKVSARQRRLG